jgi:hypothetical protein
MENPLGYRARLRRSGVKNFRDCNLKQVSPEIESINGGGYRAYATLKNCPTLQDQEKRPIKVQNSNILESSNTGAIAENAQKQLERVCGSSICAACVYADMESPVQVYTHRKEIADMRRDAAMAQKHALEAEAEVEELAAQHLGQANTEIALSRPVE